MANPFLLVIFSLFCGVTIPVTNMPHFWSSWVSWPKFVIIFSCLHFFQHRCTNSVSSDAADALS